VDHRLVAPVPFPCVLILGRTIMIWYDSMSRSVSRHGRTSADLVLALRTLDLFRHLLETCFLVKANSPCSGNLNATFFFHALDVLNLVG